MPTDAVSVDDARPRLSRVASADGGGSRSNTVVPPAIHAKKVAMYSKTLLSPKAKSSPTKERVSLLSPMIVGSSRQAAERGHSLALIRPRNTRFIYQPKKPAEERQAYKLAADQTSMFDKELAQL